MIVQEVAGLRDVQARNVALAEAVRELESQVDELGEQVDDARAAEGLVEQLTDANLALEDRVRELEECVRDLEALQAMANEVEEQHAAIARQLTTDLDFARADLAEKTRQLQLVDDEFAEYEQTIAKYRALVAALQQQSPPASSDTGGAASDDSQRVASLQLQLQVTSAKAQARAIDAVCDPVSACLHVCICIDRALLRCRSCGDWSWARRGNTWRCCRRICQPRSCVSMPIASGWCCCWIAWP